MAQNLDGLRKNDELLLQNSHCRSENVELLLLTLQDQSEKEGLLAQKSEGQTSQGKSEMKIHKRKNDNV